MKRDEALVGVINGPTTLQPVQAGIWETGNRDILICDVFLVPSCIYEWISPSRFGPSRPVYKPEFWDKTQELDQWTNFFYNEYSDYGGGNYEYCDIPTNGRARPDTVEAYYYGLSIGKWEGETLVIDSTNFVDTTVVRPRRPAAFRRPAYHQEADPEGR